MQPEEILLSSQAANAWGTFGAGMAMFFAVLFLFMVWSMVWKIWALWISARKGSKVWFGVFMFVNTLGILELLYIFKFSKTIVLPTAPTTPVNNQNN